MNNLPSYCGFVDAKIRASDKDLPVPMISKIHVLISMLKLSPLQKLKFIPMSTKRKKVYLKQNFYPEDTILSKISYQA